MRNVPEIFQLSVTKTLYALLAIFCLTFLQGKLDKGVFGIRHLNRRPTYFYPYFSENHYIKFTYFSINIEGHVVGQAHYCWNGTDDFTTRRNMTCSTGEMVK